MSSITSFQLQIRNLSKSYGSLPVWSGLDMTLDSGTTYCLMGNSGSGKTTLFRILLGLEQADGGSFCLTPQPSLGLTAVFQEDRLCQPFSPLENVFLATANTLSRKDICRELCQLLPEEAVMRPVHTLSGGMKRRVAIARAMLAPSCGILMDEPFTGLDEATKEHVISYIRKKTAGRLLLVSTHQEEDVAALDAQLLKPF